MHIWVPKKKRGLHFEARARHRDEKGRIILDTGWRHNILHDHGEELILNRIFEPAFTTYSWMVLANDCSYDDAGGAQDRYLTDRDAGSPFDKVSVNDYLYLCGGYTAAGTSVTPGYYRIDVKTDANNVSLTTDASAGDADITGGIVVIRTHNFCIGLDNRTTIYENDTTAAAEAYEEDGTGYYRELVDPDDATNTFWTVQQDSDTGDYEALSDEVTFSATAADWQPNYNAFLVAGLCDTEGTDTYLHSAAADWSNDVLISSVAFDDPITVGNGQNLGVSFRVRLKEAT